MFLIVIFDWLFINLYFNCVLFINNGSWYCLYILYNFFNFDLEYNVLYFVGWEIYIIFGNIIWFFLKLFLNVFM